MGKLVLTAFPPKRIYDFQNWGNFLRILKNYSLWQSPKTISKIIDALMDRDIWTPFTEKGGLKVVSVNVNIFLAKNLNTNFPFNLKNIGSLIYKLKREW